MKPYGLPRDGCDCRLCHQRRAVKAKSRRLDRGELEEETNRYYDEIAEAEAYAPCSAFPFCEVCGTE